MVNKATKTIGYGVVYRTNESLLKIEDWLDDNIAGKWSIGVEGLDDMLKKKQSRLFSRKPTINQNLWSNMATA